MAHRNVNMAIISPDSHKLIFVKGNFFLFNGGLTCPP